MAHSTRSPQPIPCHVALLVVLAIPTMTPRLVDACCGPGRVRVRSEAGGLLTIGNMPAVPFPTGAEIVVDVAPSTDASTCRHDLVIPPGGFVMPGTFLNPLLALDIAARGCVGGNALGSGLGWDSSAGCPRPDIGRFGDTSSPLCSALAGECNTYEG